MGINNIHSNTVVSIIKRLLTVYLFLLVGGLRSGNSRCTGECGLRSLLPPLVAQQCTGETDYIDNVYVSIAYMLRTYLRSTFSRSKRIGAEAGTVAAHIPSSANLAPATDLHPLLRLRYEHDIQLQTPLPPWKYLLLLSASEVGRDIDVNPGSTGCRSIDSASVV